LASPSSVVKTTGKYAFSIAEKEMKGCTGW
jgi:hypothetical protein